MRNSAKLLTSLAVAGLAFAGGTAFTGSGLTNAAPTTQFVGGTVSQSIQGATLNAVDYTYVDASNTSVASVNLTFADDAATYGKAVTAVLNGGTGTNLTCSGTLSSTVHAVTCSSDTAGYKGASSLDVTVAS